MKEMEQKDNGNKGGRRGEQYNIEDVIASPWRTGLKRNLTAALTALRRMDATSTFRPLSSGRCVYVLFIKQEKKRSLGSPEHV
jgi:hypothetical protein